MSSRETASEQDQIANSQPFQIQFTAKQLNRQAAKAGKDETAEKNKLKKVRINPPLCFFNRNKKKRASRTPTAGADGVPFLRAGNTAEPPGHRQDLRAKRDPEAEREAQPAALGLEDRCRRQQGADGGDDAAGHGQHGGRGARDGGRDESHGSGEGEDWEQNLFLLSPRSVGLTVFFFSKKFQISAVMDKFETQFEDLDVATGYYENATSSATAVGTPQDDVDKLMHMVADEAGVELGAEMKAPETGVPAAKVGAEDEREEGLGERLRALRN